MKQLLHLRLELADGKGFRHAAIGPRPQGAVNVLPVVITVYHQEEDVASVR